MDRNKLYGYHTLSYHMISIWYHRISYETNINKPSIYWASPFMEPPLWAAHPACRLRCRPRNAPLLSQGLHLSSAACAMGRGTHIFPDENRERPPKRTKKTRKYMVNIWLIHGYYMDNLWLIIYTLWLWLTYTTYTSKMVVIKDDNWKFPIYRYTLWLWLT
jgi:hypothetical protein